MTKSNLMAIATFLALAAPLEAGAQALEHSGPTGKQPLEIGFGLGTVGSWWTGPFSGGDVRLGFPIKDRGALEAVVAYSAKGPEDEMPIGFYGAQFRQDFRRRSRASTQPFLTYGALGIFGREGSVDYQTTNRDGTTFVTHADSSTYVTPPVIGVFGAGVQQRVTRRLAVRVDVQTYLVFIIPVGVRVAAGATIPIGRLHDAGTVPSP